MDVVAPEVPTGPELSRRLQALDAITHDRVARGLPVEDPELVALTIGVARRRRVMTLAVAAFWIAILVVVATRVQNAPWTIWLVLAPFAVLNVVVRPMLAHNNVRRLERVTAERARRSA